MNIEAKALAQSIAIAIVTTVLFAILCGLAAELVVLSFAGATPFLIAFHFAIGVCVIGFAAGLAVAAAYAIGGLLRP